MGAFPSYPYSLVPRGRRRRGGGMTFFRAVYLGSHPVATLIALVITLYLWALVLAWVLLVTVAWLLCGLIALPFRRAARDG